MKFKHPKFNGSLIQLISPLFSFSFFLLSLFISLLVLPFPSYTQTTFKKSIPIGVQNEVGYDIIETDDKGFLIAGYNTLLKDSIWKTCLIKLDSSGNLIAKYDLSSGINSGAYRLKKTSDGGYILAGYNLDTSSQQYHIYALKVNSAMQVECEKQLPAVLGSVDNWSVNPAVDIWQKPDGNFIICGSDGVIMDEKKGYVAELDSCLDMVWSSIYDVPGFTLSLHAMKPTPDGGFVFTGYARKIIGSNNSAVLLKTNDVGWQEWIKVLGDSLWNEYTNAALVENNGYILAGKKYSLCCGHDGGTWQPLLMKTDLSGNLLWETVYPYSDGGLGDDYDDIFGIERAYDGGYLLAGYLGGDANNKEFVIIKSDTSGNEVWKKIFGYPSEEVCFSFKKTSDSGIVMTGYNTFGEVWDLFVVKTADAPAPLCEDRPVVSCFADTAMDGDTISFTSMVTGGTPPYSYFWTGPGGFASLEPNPKYVYPEHRVFYYGLYVSDAYDCIGRCENYATVVDPCDSSGFPTVTSASDTAIVGDTTHFTSSVIGNAPPFQYFWSGLGGLEDTIPNPVHAYPQAGVYYYQLQVTDSLGCLTRHEAYTFISDTCKNKPSVTTTADTLFVISWVKNTWPTHFTSEVQGGTPPYYYTWYGDNQLRDSVPAPEHIYKWPGSYFYGLVVRDDQNCFGFSSGYAQIIDKCAYYGSPVATCSADTVLLGDSTHFQLQVTGGTPPYSYFLSDEFQWSTSPNPVFYYPAPGVYPFYFSVNDTNICMSEQCEGVAVVLDTVSTSLSKNSVNTVLVKIYPNPTQNEFTLLFKGEIKEDMIFEISNSLGQTVFHQIITTHDSGKYFNPTLPKGIYIYRLTRRSGKEIVSQGKLVRM